MEELKLPGHGITSKENPIVLVLPSRANVFTRPKLILYAQERTQIITVKLGLNNAIVYEFKPVTLFAERPTQILNWDTQNLNPYSPKYFNRIAIIGSVSIPYKVYFKFLWMSEDFDPTQNVSRPRMENR